MRLINGSALYEQIAEIEGLARQRVIDTPSRMPNGDFNQYAMRYATQLDERTKFKFMVADAPTIEAKLVKHGKWIVDDEFIDCSACGHEKWSKTPYEDLVKRFRYCPNCGAKMDEVEE